MPYTHLDGECLRVFGTTFLDDRVPGRRQLFRLRKLLKSTFEIDDGKRRSGPERSQIPGDVPAHQPAYRFDASVQIDACDESFDGIRKKRFLASAARQFFSPAKQKILTKIELLSDVVQVIGTDKMSFELGELTLR